MKRIQHRRPGYDCLYAPCKHERKGDHGINGGNYLWGVVADEGDVAIVLNLHADEWPETIPEDTRRRVIHGKELSGNIGFHTSRPVSRAQLLAPPSTTTCDYLGGVCYDAGATYTGVDVFKPFLAFDATDKLLYGQPEAFWAALTAYAETRIPGLRADMTEIARWQVCPTCHGDQTVPVSLPQNVASWCAQCPGVVVGPYAPSRACGTCGGPLHPLHVGPRGAP